MESPPMFNSVEDECRYWKERAKLYHKEWTDVKQEYDEYVEQSRQMEAEMDATLDQKQGIIKDLRMKLTSFEKENESLKLKLESHSIEFANVEKQLENTKSERDSMKDYLRQLEQKNDDLERAHRILNESIVDFEKMLDKAYEKNALLEMEVDEKEVLQEKLQRLMDETRDLKQELNVKSRYQPINSANNSINTTASLTIPNGVVNNGDISHDTISAATNNLNNSTTTNIHGYNNQHSLKNPDSLLNGNAISASSRTTALNIVADMLRKLNLDKALLCPQCDRFRCVCDRLPSVCDTTAHSPSAPATQSSDNISRLRRSITSTFGNSNSINATYVASNSTTSTTSTDVQDAAGASLRRSASRSNNSLNFGTNIFKRFAERMSGNANSLSTFPASTPPSPPPPPLATKSTTIVTTPTVDDLKSVTTD